MHVVNMYFSVLCGFLSIDMQGVKSPPRCVFIDQANGLKDRSQCSMEFDDNLFSLFIRGSCTNQPNYPINAWNLFGKSCGSISLHLRLFDLYSQLLYLNYVRRAWVNIHAIWRYTIIINEVSQTKMCVTWFWIPKNIRSLALRPLSHL